VRQGGAYEARQWVWGIKNAPLKDPLIKESLENIKNNFGTWMARCYPFKKGDSPLSAVPEYEDFIFDQASNMEYGPYWKQIGLNTEEFLDEFTDIPVLWMSGWYDIYARSTVEFFTHLVNRKKGPHLLIMGPWQHVGPEGHVAGDVDFGVNALISGNLAPSVPSLARRWFDRWVTPAIDNPNKNIQAEEQSATSVEDLLPSVRGPHTSLSRIPPAVLAATVSANHPDALKYGPTPYVLPSSLPRDRSMDEEGPLPPTVRYFRMGGGDGHKTSQGYMMHGGVWMATATWPPPGTKYVNYYLQKRNLNEGIYDDVVKGNVEFTTETTVSTSTSSNTLSIPAEVDALSTTMQKVVNVHGEGLVIAPGTTASNSSVTMPSSSSSSSSSSSATTAVAAATATAVVSMASNITTFVPHIPSPSILSSSSCVSTYDYNPRSPCPSIGGNVFGYKDVLLAGAFNQIERAGHFLCKEPYLPLSARHDVLVFRTPILHENIDVTGTIHVHLYISSSCVDTDFTAKLIDEYPPSPSYPQGYAMNITHGICRARFRDSRTHASLMEPGKVYSISIQLYPTSNLFQIGHRIRLDISSSNFPHFDLNMGTGKEFEDQTSEIQRNSIFHTQIYPSRIVFPIQGNHDHNAPTTDIR
jgi:predicted acyl esterase